MCSKQPALNILGTRGIPARHGGFETFAQHLSLYLEGRGWDITVYCQETGRGRTVEEYWRGIRLVKIPVNLKGPAGTMVFDWKAALNARQRPGVHLVLGYNTALFNMLLVPRKAGMIFNMDGLEWKREKWSAIARAWLYLNERAACLSADHLVADHPEIKKHLLRIVKRDNITMIPYGAPHISEAPVDCLKQYGVQPGNYLLLVARPEPENSILEVVRGFSLKRQGIKLLLLGNYSREHPYQAKVLDAASDEVVFAGAIYNEVTVSALRFHAMAYVHGHTVGGTNPSLVEALGAGNAVIAHDNRFNRWVTGEEAAMFFDSQETFLHVLDKIRENPGRLQKMKDASRKRFKEHFTWTQILKEYENCLLQFVNGSG